MINSKAFKKLAALTAAIALVGSFAVSASAADVKTKTAYFAGSDEIAVNVSVEGLAEGDMVTYYGSNGSVFHMDQAEADAAGKATFTQYVTDAANLEADVIVGYEDAATDAEKVEGNAITINGAKVVTLPTEETGYTATVEYTIQGSNHVVAQAATVTGASSATVTETGVAGTYSVAIAGITGDVTVSFVETERLPEYETEGEWIAAGYVETAEGRMVTVIGKVTDLEPGKAYGATIAGTDYASKVFATNEGYFVIQLIDDEGILTEDSVDTGIYFEKGAATLRDNGTATTLAQ